ncbi:MAG: 4-hydroxy-tetrahydrodipicolinate reductase [Oscillospiraceae bacterium]|nr:4-hydroxy-tetrahydrodipicolinate reductase [Oscillospiraceae bacterium]
MIRILLSGCNGYMGQIVAAIAAENPDITIAAGVDIVSREHVSFPVFADPLEFVGTADAIIDFSSPLALDRLLEYGLANKTPLVLCATGYTTDQTAVIKDAAKQIPIFRSGNMSLGINLLIDLVKRSCAVLGEAFDIEIVERHHRRKVDAPSGTALMLADAAASALPYAPEYVFAREGKSQPRTSREIGISSIRGGSVVGEHEIIFAGLDEVIELRHSAASRDIFAVGAIKAAKFITGSKEAGLYDMNDVLADCSVEVS